MFAIILLFVFINNSVTVIINVVLTTNETQKLSVVLPYMDGGKFPELNIKEIRIHQYEYWETSKVISFISHFPFLEEIILRNSSLKVIPNFRNVPNFQVLNMEYNDITTVTNGSFSNTSLNFLVLSKNSIKKIEPGSFGKKITWLELRCNELTEFSREWFQNVRILEILDLGGNKITVLPKLMLKNFKNLAELDLSNNQILVVNKLALSGPRKMEYMSLSGNKITELKATAIKKRLNFIYYFDISYNRLNFLSDNFLDRLALAHFGVHGNPWNCLCLKNIEQWMAKKGLEFLHFVTNITFGDPICISPLTNSDKCNEQVDTELYNSYVKTLTDPVQKFCFPGFDLY